MKQVIDRSLQQVSSSPAGASIDGNWGPGRGGDQETCRDRPGGWCGGNEWPDGFLYTLCRRECSGIGCRPPCKVLYSTGSIVPGIGDGGAVWPGPIGREVGWVGVGVDGIPWRGEHSEGSTGTRWRRGRPSSTGGSGGYPLPFP